MYLEEQRTPRDGEKMREAFYTVKKSNKKQEKINGYDIVFYPRKTELHFAITVD
jgi:hypothetical protein